MTAFRTTRGQAPISRFAPSPTGLLHLGHAYSAIRSHDVARSGSGRFILRIEDIDEGRCRPHFVDAIFGDLRWLGLDWDEVVIQSARGEAHARALERLRSMGLVYRCVCTRAEIAASAPHGPEPVYSGTCRRTPVAADNPRPACWRLDVQTACARAGDDAALPQGDIVIARKGGAPSYHLAATVDDAECGVTQVVRGIDLAPAEAVHRLLQRLLGYPAPKYVHHPLVLGPDGKRLAKRTPGATLADLRASGADPGRLREDLRAGALPIGFSFASA